MDDISAPVANAASLPTGANAWPLNQLRGSLFARSLRCKLNRLEGRRLLDEAAAAATATTAASDSGCQCGACGCATALSTSLTERPPEGADISFLLGRFLSGSDPALARGSFDLDDDQRSTDGSSYIHDTRSPPTPDDGVHGVLVNPFVMDEDDLGKAEEEEGHEERSRTEPIRLEGSISSGYGSELDVQHMNGGKADDDERKTEVPQYSLQSSMIEADFLLGSRSLGSACSLTTDDDGSGSSGISTPLTSLMFGSHETIPVEMAEEAERSSGLVAIPESALKKVEPNYLTFKTGEETHRVATAKLNNLLNLLERSSENDSQESLRPKRCDSAPSLATSEDRSSLDSIEISNSMVEIRVTPPNAPAVETEAETTARLQRELKETLTEPEKPRKLRKASSLKSGKTPPNTPGKSKIVRYSFYIRLLYHLYVK